MDNDKFIEYSKKAIVQYLNEYITTPNQKKVKEDDIYVVWLCKTLKNNKALLSTTLPDGMYYECTYNGEKRELYLDSYKKVNNKAISLELYN